MDKRVPAVRRRRIDWENPQALTVDGFTVAEIEQFVHDDVVQARCTRCDEEHTVEPDARRYDCQGCGAKGCVTSPLVKLGLI